MTDQVIAEGANAVRESLRQPDSYWTHLWKGLKYRSTDGETVPANACAGKTLRYKRQRHADFRHVSVFF